jgi:cystathionine beta-lyase
MLALLKAGDEVLAADCIYDPTRRFCSEVLARFGVATRYFHPAASAEEVMALAGPATRLIVLESPGSLTFDLQDVPAIARLARDRGVLTLIDNTWAAGLLFRPLDHGVDVSVQALTKYVGGHSDVFMGSAATRSAKVARLLDEAVWHMGWSASPDDAYQMLRGIRTLPTRLVRHGESALAIARWLKTQPEVLEVICPGLPGSRGHALWKRDFTGQNGLFSIVLQPKPQAAVYALLDTLQLFGLGFSWGGFESLAIHCDPQLSRRSLDWRYEGPLVRFHVGLEDVEDLKADLRRGLDAYAAS